jgi:hypothetical protein
VALWWVGRLYAVPDTSHVVELVHPLEKGLCAEVRNPRGPSRA